MIRREIKKLKPTHYVATHGHPSQTDIPHLVAGRGYSVDADSTKAPSEKTISEYVVATEKRKKMQKDIEGLRPYRPPSATSRYSSRPRSVISLADSRASTTRSSKSRRSKVVIATVPNPFCPRVKGMCCLMFLINFGLILVTLGIVIVIQFIEPIYVWVLGIVFLVFGFLTLLGCIVYCTIYCRRPEADTRSEMVWTTHYHKNIRYLPNTIDYHKSRNYLDSYDRGRHSVSRNSGAYSSDVESSQPSPGRRY